MSSLGSTPSVSITGEVKVLDEFNMAKFKAGSVVRYHCFRATEGQPTKGGLW